MLTMIIAIDKNNLVGSSTSKNGLAWHYPEDLKYYKEQTVNKINIMGSATYKAIGRALPNRTTYVLSRNPEYKLDDAIVLNDINEIDNIKSEQEIMIIGGVDIFKQLLPKIDKVLLTKIDATHDGDIYYDDLNLDGFKLEKSYSGENEILTFEIWKR